MRTLYFALVAAAAGVAACSTPASFPTRVAASAGCDRLGNTSRSVSALFNSGNVYAAGAATERRWTNQGPPEPTLVGAQLYVHATPGMTAEYLQRVLECYTTGDRSVHPNDPFHPAKGSVTEVAVAPAGDSFAVRIVGSDDQAISDISSRARALTSTGTARQVSQASAPVAPL